MKIYQRIEVADLDGDPRIVLKFNSKSSEYPDKDSSYYWLDDDTHFIFGVKHWYQPYSHSTGKWLGGSSMEFPKPGLPWFIGGLENQFFKSSKEGGLPRGKFTFDEKVDGEDLVIARMMGDPGYSFRNDSRQNYIKTLKKAPQTMDLQDHLLFKEGLFDQLKALAEKVKRGEI